MEIVREMMGENVARGSPGFIREPVRHILLRNDFRRRRP
jgi:hypothetical protein